MKNRSASVLIYLFIVLAFAVYSSPAWANSTYWTGATSGNWFTSSNWTAGLPDCSTDAFFNNGGKATIDGLVATTPSLTLGESGVGGGAPGSGTVSVDGTNGGALLVRGCIDAPAPGAIYVGNGGSGTFEMVNGGSVESGEGFIAQFEGSYGSVTVGGSNSTTNSKWTLTEGRLFVGRQASGDAGGTAVLNVTNGGAVTVTNPSNSAQPGIDVGLSGTVTGDGTITVIGNNSFTRRMAVLGTIAPTGTLQINGNLRLLEEATMLATVTSQAQDKVNVSGTSGTAELNGRLVVILSGTFSPNLECVARFTLLHADGGRGVSQFASVSIQDTTLNAPYTPQITYDANNVYLDLVFSNCE